MIEGARKQGRGVGGMSTRTAAWLAWSMCAYSLALTALSLLLLALNLSHPGVHILDFWLENTVAAAGFSTVGAVIVSRRPKHIIGWLLSMAGLFIGGLNHFSSEYAIYTLLAQPGSLPGGEVAAWLAFWLFVPALTLMMFLFLLFPTGRLPSSRWRWFAGFSGAHKDSLRWMTPALAPCLLAYPPRATPMSTPARRSKYFGAAREGPRRRIPSSLARFSPGLGPRGPGYPGLLPRARRGAR